MITSFSRLFRQIFGGSQAQPVTEAPSRDSVAEGEAREAAEHRENLKRAMEAAFATPTAAPEELHEPSPQPVLELQAAAEELAAEIATEAPAQVIEEPAIEEPAIEEPAIEEPAIVDPQIAEAEAFVAEAPQPLVTEHPPAIDLAEVEEQGEHDVEILEWDIAKLVEDTAEREAPAIEERAAEAETVTEVEEEAPAEVLIEDEARGPAQAPAAEAAAVEEAVAAAPKAKRTKKAKAPAKKKTATKKKAAPKKSADLPDDAVWLSDAIAFSLKGEWANVWTPPEDASGAERLESFREKAAAGDLAVWGKPEGADAWELVKATYWKTAFVEPLSFLMGRENVTTDPSTSKAKKPVKYTALKVAQSEVESLWPATAETVRDAA